MTEKAVIVHASIMREWATDPSMPQEAIRRALGRIDEVVRTLPPEDIVIVEELASTGFPSLPAKVGSNNSAKLYGVRAAYCLRIARIALETAGIQVTLDHAGVLP